MHVKITTSALERATVNELLTCSAPSTIRHFFQGEGMPVCFVFDSEWKGSTLDIKIEGAFATIVGEAVAKVSTGFALDETTSEEGERVLWVERVLDLIGQLGTIFVQTEVAVRATIVWSRDALHAGIAHLVAL